jgi:hypothetical protein
LTKRPHIFAVLVLTSPAFFGLSLLARTTERGQSRDPIASSGPQNGSTGPASSVADAATILGTVTDVNGQAVAGAIISLQVSQPGEPRTVTTNDNGFFEIHDVAPGVPCHITVSAAGFAPWNSAVVVLKPGQHQFLDVSALPIQEVRTDVTVTPESSNEIAVQQVKVEETQRGFGIIPNFFAVYDPNPAPLTAKLKFSLSLKVLKDPFTLAGVAMMAGAGQWGEHPNYPLGLKGFGERFGANYTNQFTTILIGGAVLPSLLHQDPRYYYQGRGSKASRTLHALSSLVITKGDNGRTEPNISSLGGDLASAAIANAYYPEQNEGAKLILENFAINTAVHAGVRLLQEFVFRPGKGIAKGQPADDLQSK